MTGLGAVLAGLASDPRAFLASHPGAPHDALNAVSAAGALALTPWWHGGSGPAMRP
ncbi:MAG: hypothetical protein R2712_20885 [Vicinamibacterales bacterium]